MCESCGCIPLARSRVYQFLSAALSDLDQQRLELLRSQAQDTERSLAVLEDESSLEAMRGLSSVLLSSSAGELEAAYIGTFGHNISKECPPYEAEYDQAHIFQQSQSLADIAGFYRAFGLELAPGYKDRLDHLSVETEFMHFLCLKEAYALAKGHSEEQLNLCREAQAKFLGEHLGRWGFRFVEKLDEKARGNIYGLVGRLLAAFLAFEVSALELEPEQVHGLNGVDPSEETAAECEECPLVMPTSVLSLRTGG